MTDRFIRRTLAVVAIAILALLGVGLLLYASHVFLLAFAGILFGILLSALAENVVHFTHMPRAAALTGVIIVLLTFFGGIFYVAGSSIADQVDQLAETLPRSIRQVTQKASRYAILRQYLNDGDHSSGNSSADESTTRPVALASGPETRPADEAGTPATRPVPSPGKLAAMIVHANTSSFGATLGKFAGLGFGLITALIVVSVVGVYVAASPALYVGGLLHLVPINRRERVRHVLASVGYTLRWWMAGQATTMLAIGTVTAIGLCIIGVPLWPLFGLLAGLFNFIPNFGPLLSFTPAVLLAWSNDPHKALWVIALYVVAQSLEGYVLSPLIQRRAVEMPPALLIVAQVIMGLLAGPLGVMLAAPLTAASFVAVKMLYVEDALGDVIATPDDKPEVRRNAEAMP